MMAMSSLTERPCIVAAMRKFTRLPRDVHGDILDWSVVAAD